MSLFVVIVGAIVVSADGCVSRRCCVGVVVLVDVVVSAVVLAAVLTAAHV